MASKKQVFILLLSLFAVSSIIKSSHASSDNCLPRRSENYKTAVYWGQVTAEGSLKEACDTNHYDIVILEFLYLYDDGRTPYLNFAGHCGGEDDPCTKLESEIKHCQDKGIKLLLSIGGIVEPPTHRHLIASSQDVVDQTAEYLFDHFLSGQKGPLGSVALDGIDIPSVADGKNIKWDGLVKAIHSIRTTHEKKIHLSAGPQCVYPDHFLNNAIKTDLFDYLWVKFYQNSPCEFTNGNSVRLFRAWDKWTSSVHPSNSVFLSVPAAREAASSGFIPPEVLKSEILPTLEESSNFGGVTIFNRYYDKQTDFSDQIRAASVSKVACKKAFSGRSYSL